MALANPVMGTSVPAPARLATLSKTPNPVSRAARKTRVTDTAVAGRLGSADALAGLAVGAVLFDLLLGSFNFLRSHDRKA